MTSARNAPASGGVAAPPDRPVRFADPERNRRYWERIERIVDAAPPLDDTQRAVIRTAFSQPAAREAA
ncbi:hypothetical protein JL475_30665 [Streptomyces sp. M2CJ-2]|uniref:hypothetical protein n=1 Tax=Streptomyces sp. M2CJ-2 TaxID=2803948 RepID=UPI00192734A9|nr:hypothetical protein [Streptomyces sp. M2CJ-2]MBL3670263.1 hypothetical protein [Streptomyces sp. M2CJ-2]